MTRAGRHLDRDAIAALEKQNAENPTDVDSRTKVAYDLSDERGRDAVLAVSFEGF